MRTRKLLAMLLACAMIFAALPVSLLAEELPAEVVETPAEATETPAEEPAEPEIEISIDPTAEAEIPAAEEPIPEEPAAEPIPEEPASEPTEEPLPEAPAAEPSEEPKDSDFVIEDGVLVEYTGSDAHVTIPNGVTAIGDGAFAYNEELVSISIPSSVRSIGSYVFFGCTGLQSANIPDTVTDLDWGIFGYCENLSSVKLPSRITSIPENMFEGCYSLVSIDIPDSVTKIEEEAFMHCSSLENISIPAGVTRIEPDTFYGCSSLRSIDIPNSVVHIGESSFQQCESLTAVTLPNGITKISEYAFAQCTELASVNLPRNLTQIGERAFWACNMSSLTIPANVTVIDTDAFLSCSNLTSLVIEHGVTTINSGAFAACSNLTSVTIPASVTSIGERAFNSCRKAVIRVHEGSYAHQYCISNAAAQGFTYQVIQSDPDPLTLGRVEMDLSHVISSLKLKLTWHAVDNAQGYELWRSDAPNGNYTKIGETTALELTDTNCLFGQINYYKARAYATVNGERVYGPFSVYRSCFGLATPGVRSVQLQDNGSVKITAATVANATGYYIYRCETVNGLYERLGTTTVTGGDNVFIDTTAQGDHQYFYKARAYHISSTGVTYVGPFSVAKSITIVSTRLERVTMDLSHVISSLKLKLTWYAVPNADGYELWRSDSPNGDYTKIGETAALELTDENCLFGQINYYKVRAYKNIGTTRTYGAFSVYRSCFGLATPGIRSVICNQDELVITAATVANATGYYIYRCETVNGLYERLGTTTLQGGVNSYADDDIELGKTYYYKARAYYVSPTGVTYVGPFSVAKSGMCPAQSPITQDQRWRMVEMRMVFGQTVYSFNEAELAAEGLVVELLLKRNGNAEMIANGESTGDLTWTDHGSYIIVTDGIDPLRLDRVGNQLKVEMIEGGDAIIMVFEQR